MRAYWLIPALIGSICAVAAADPRTGLSSWLQVHAELAASEERIAELTRETTALRREIEALESDPFALERAIREELELARPGEVVVRFERTDGY